MTAGDRPDGGRQVGARPLLQGVTVIENANVITGPFAGQILADLGADVIKVEGPHGDQFRQWEGSAAPPMPPTFAAYNRGKRSISIDLKTEPGVGVFRKLAREADVILENSRPGSMDSLGVGYWDLSQDNPGLIYCSISGMGSTGPQSSRPTFDAVAQAASGLWSQLTDMARPEPVGPPLADQLTGMYSVIGVLSALQRRAVTGEGVYLETNMLAACLGFQTLSVSTFYRTGEIPDRLARARVSQSYAFTDNEGRAFAVHLSSPQKFWAGLCRVAGRADLITDDRFDIKDKRIARYEELRDELAAVFATGSREHWLAELGAADVPAAPILDLEQALRTEQVQAIGIADDGGEPEGAAGTDAAAGIGMVKLPIAVEAQFYAATAAPPQLGEHTDEILADIGLSADEIAGLRGDQVVR